MNEQNTDEKLPMRPMDLDSTQNDIQRLESEALIHDNPFVDQTAGKLISGFDPEPVKSSHEKMKGNVYKLIEIVGTSPDSVEEAVRTAIQEAHKTVKNLCWLEVVETRGMIAKGKVQEWQVTVKVGFHVAK